MPKAYQTLSDIKLIELYRNQDGTAGNVLYDKYKDALLEHIKFDLLHKLSYDRPPDAKDILQTTFEKVFANIGKYDPKKGKFATWLFSIAFNCAVDCIRQSEEKKIERAYKDVRDTTKGYTIVGISSGGDDDEEKEAGVTSASELIDLSQLTPEQKLIITDFLKGIYQALKKIENDDYRLAVYTRNCLGMSFNEINELTGRPKNSLKSDFKRGIEQFTDILVRNLGYDKNVISEFLETKLLASGNNTGISGKSLESIVDRKTREAVKLKHINGLSYKEIAKELSLDVKEVKQRITAGLKEFIKAGIERSIDLHVKEPQAIYEKVSAEELADYVDLLFKGMANTSVTRTQQKPANELKETIRMLFLSSLVMRSGNMEAATLGKLILLKLSNKKLELGEFTGKLGIDAVRLSRFINNREIPDDGILRKISSLIAVPFDRLKSLGKVSEPIEAAADVKLNVCDTRTEYYKTNWSDIDKKMKKIIHKLMPGNLNDINNKN